ncbi:MAG: MAPEG family protein [Rhizobiales bacterium]|nr:MAPEG family protein [Hyphomicrobiales bacterium]
MTLQAVLLPLFVQVILTFVVLYMMAFGRGAALKTRAVDWHDIALGEKKWPQRETQFANAYANQFELPVLFYVLTILAWVTRQADLLFVVMAWIFVLSRIAQAWVHVTDNHVPRRGAFFGIGGIVLTLMWVIFMIRILLRA